MKFASRSAILSLNSAKAGSSEARGSTELPENGPEGVVCEARKEVRESGRRGVVGRELADGLRTCEGVAILWAGFYGCDVCVAVSSRTSVFWLYLLSLFVLTTVFTALRLYVHNSTRCHYALDHDNNFTLSRLPRPPTTTILEDLIWADMMQLTHRIANTNRNSYTGHRLDQPSTPTTCRSRNIKSTKWAS
jgi:hypothetical protein